LPQSRHDAHSWILSRSRIPPVTRPTSASDGLPRIRNSWRHGCGQLVPRPATLDWLYAAAAHLWRFLARAGLSGGEVSGRGSPPASRVRPLRASHVWMAYRKRTCPVKGAQTDDAPIDTQSLSRFLPSME
jgi:hypothetical protein